MSKDNKYGDVDELLSGHAEESSSVSSVPKRAKRPSPALGVMTGDSRPTSVTDGLKAEKNQIELELKEAKKLNGELAKQLEDAKGNYEDVAPVYRIMPVTKQKIGFYYRSIDPSLIDVAEENERIQEFLDEVSLMDILPSIKDSGQQEAGTLRPKPDGRFELISGSRRLAAVKIAGQEYLALVGDVPDADVEALSKEENKHKDTSAYEKAVRFQSKIDSGKFENWTQLGVVEGISSSHISRYRACVELDKLFVRILPSPSDMPLSYGETIIKLLRKDEASLREKAKDVLDIRNSALKEKTKLPDVEDIIRLLKSAVRTKSAAPKTWKPIVYKSSDGNTSVKHTVSNTGSTKFELKGVSEEKVGKILEYLQNTLKLEC